MKNFINRIHVGGLMLLAAVLILTVSWKSLNSDSNTTKWYVVEIVNEGTQDSYLQIAGEYPGDRPTFPCDEYEGKICAIQLTASQNQLILPIKLDEAYNNPAIVIIGTAHTNMD